MIRLHHLSLGSHVRLTCALAALACVNSARAQLNDGQNFNGLATSNVPYAIAPNTVANWSLDGGCTPGTVFQDGNKGDNGTRCLRSPLVAGVGTRLIRDLNPGPGSSNIGTMASVSLDLATRLYLSADDGAGTSGQELYQVLQALYPVMTLKSDINLGAGSSNPQNLFQWSPGSATKIFFSADDGTTGRELYLASMNGSLVTTTTLVKDINPSGSSNPSGFAVAGTGTLVLCSADDGTNGRRLWKTDGTGPLTLMVVDPVTPTTASDPQLLTSVGTTSPLSRKVYFTATTNDGLAGRELWVSDGTAVGTGMCKDIVAGPTSSNPTNLTGGANLLASVAFFTVDSDASGTAELWKSGGALTGADTVMVKDIGTSPANLKAAGNLIFFTIGNDLWKSDGTTVGTVLVQSFTSIAGPMATLSSSVYFAADNGAGHGVELWKSDGTTTTEVKDINPGPGSSSPVNLTPLNAQLYFSADDGAHGQELWRSDTTLGAVLIKDINPGAAGSNPAKFALLENISDISTGAPNVGPFGSIAFTADDGTHGTELWQTDGVPGGVADHAGMSYKWDLVPVIQAHDAAKSAVAGTDANVLSVYWVHDVSGLGAGSGIWDGAHEANFYIELTDGVDRAPLNITNVSCGDGNVTRPVAALTDGTSHKAIAFGMVAVLDQNPCDTDSRVPGSPGVPVADVPALYDGHDWIPIDLDHVPAGVPTTPPTTTALARAILSGNIGIPTNSALPTLAAGDSLSPSGDNPWATKRFLTIRFDLFTDYVRIVWYSKQANRLYVASVPRQYKGGFKALYMGNKACAQQSYTFYSDSLNLNGGLLATTVDPYGACCAPAGCSDVLSPAACPVGVFSPWKACSEILCCPNPRADADRDGDVDIDDFAAFQRCYTGIGGGPATGQCRCFDFVSGSGINQDDFNAFVPCKTGSGVPFNLLSPPVGCSP